MRVLFLTHYYPPEVGAPQARISALAAGLAGRGVAVTVHTGFPHYPDGVLPAGFANRPLLRGAPEDGVRILRSLVYPAANRGFARRIADHAAFAASAVATAPASGPQDLVVVESPPLFCAAAGAVYAALKRAPMVLNVADRWPASAVALGSLTDRRAVAAAERLERWCYARAAAVTMPTRGLELQIGTLPEAAGKAHRLWPAVDVERFDPAPAPPAGPLRVLYAGTVGLAQNVTTLVDAARIAGPGVVRVTVAGDGAQLPAVRERVAAGRIANVRVLGRVAHDAIPGLYRDADAGVVLLRDREIFSGALPTKLLEVMAAGRVCIVAARGEAPELVRATGAGVDVAPESPAALAAAFRALHADREAVRRLGTAGRAAAEARFARGAMVDRWLALLSELAPPGG